MKKNFASFSISCLMALSVSSVANAATTSTAMPGTNISLNTPTVLSATYTPGGSSLPYATPGSVSTQNVMVTTDPYCPNGIDITSNVATNSCLVGEANRNNPYNNPWITGENIIGEADAPFIYAWLMGENTIQSNASEIARESHTTQPESLATLMLNTSDEIAPSNLCQYPVSFAVADDIQAMLTSRGIQANILSPSTLYVHNLTLSDFELATGNGKYAMVDSTAGGISHGEAYQYSSTDWSNPTFQALVASKNVQFGADKIARCLDGNYVSNYPAWSKYFTNYMQTQAVTSGPSPYYYSTLPGGTSVTSSASGLTSSGSASGSDTTASLSTTASSATNDMKQPIVYTTKTLSSATTNISSYTVSVNYDKFTAEAAQYGYTSVYSTTGTQSVSISLIKFPAGSSITASQAISQLAALGYRPATLSEIYSLKQTQPGAVNGTTVALGTSLGTTYGYPTGTGVGAAGLGHYTGPFSTSVYTFLAVQN